MALQRFQNQDYTGQNRCMACTITNLLVTGILALLLYVAFQPILAAGFTVLALAMIYLQGYLIPQTPELTKQYLPDSLLAYFGKDSQSRLTVDIDPEEVFTQEGILRGTDKEDVKLTENVVSSFQTQIPKYKGFPKADLESVLGDGQYAIHYDEHADAAEAFVGGNKFAQWPSTAAAVTDITAGRVLRDEFLNWEYYTPTERAVLLKGFRALVETCPACGGTISVGQKTRESCCSSHDVVTVSCVDCQNALLEFRSDELAT